MTDQYAFFRKEVSVGNDSFPGAGHDALQDVRPDRKHEKWLNSLLSVVVPLTLAAER